MKQGWGFVLVGASLLGLPLFAGQSQDVVPGCSLKSLGFTGMKLVPCQGNWLLSG